MISESSMKLEKRRKYTVERRSSRAFRAESKVLIERKENYTGTRGARSELNRQSTRVNDGKREGKDENISLSVE